MFVVKLPTFEKRCETPAGNMPYAANWKKFFVCFNLKTNYVDSSFRVTCPKLNVHHFNY